MSEQKTCSVCGARGWMVARCPDGKDRCVKCAAKYEVECDKKELKPYYQDNLVWWYNKDCRSMDELPDGCIQMVCTSPPYWGLRKYADLPDLVWGGDKDCEHEWLESSHIANKSGGPSDKQKSNVGAWNPDGIVSKHGLCSLCGAWKGAYGLEPTPEMYIQHTIEILREIRRVLRKDGVVFWNIGDSYVTSSPGTSYMEPVTWVEDEKSKKEGMTRTGKVPGLKPKDLCLIPFRVAIVAQEDGWWVRSVIIWSKPNPMPESVTDRPTESHEYILMLTKSGTPQYWTHRDGGGTRQRPKADYRWVNQLTNEEVAVEPADWKDKIPCSDCNGTGKETAVLWGDYEVEIGKCPNCGGKGKVKLWKRINLWRGHDYYWDADAVREPQSETSHPRFAKGQEDNPPPARQDSKEALRESYKDWRKYTGIHILPLGRNIRSVWEFPTQPYPEAHFAVFPEKLPELCIKAATPEVGCCSKCGAPWQRIVGGMPSQFNIRVRDAKAGRATPEEGYKATQEEINGYPGNHPDPGYRQTLGWQPTCSCNADKVPSIVLDPFLGAGTTLWVAKILGRRTVGYELSEAYCALSLERNRQMVMKL